LRGKGFYVRAVRVMLSGATPVSEIRSVAAPVEKTIEWGFILRLSSLEFFRRVAAPLTMLSFICGSI